MPEWIHSRAEHLLAKNPSMPKSQAFAVATQQSHALGKTPKGYGTSEGRAAAKKVYSTPKDDVKKANPGNLDSPKLAAMRDELMKGAGLADRAYMRDDVPSRAGLLDRASALAGDVMLTRAGGWGALGGAMGSGSGSRIGGAATGMATAGGADYLAELLAQKYPGRASAIAKMITSVGAPFIGGLAGQEYAKLKNGLLYKDAMAKVALDVTEELTRASGFARNAITRSGVRLRSSPTMRGVAGKVEQAALRDAPTGVFSHAPVPSHLGDTVGMGRTALPPPKKVALSRPKAPVTNELLTRADTGFTGAHDPRLRTSPTEHPEVRAWHGERISASPTQHDANMLWDQWSHAPAAQQEAVKGSAFAQAGIPHERAYLLGGDSPAWSPGGELAEAAKHRAAIVRHPNPEVRAAALENLHARKYASVVAMRKWLEKRADLVPGGKADGKTDKDFDQRQLRMGHKVEREHTKNPAVAAEITRDHLEEIPDYYTRLDKMEASAPKRKEAMDPDHPYLLDQVGKPKIRKTSALPPNKNLRVKLAFEESMYSGGTGGHLSLVQTNYIPPFKDPPVKTAGPPAPSEKKARIIKLAAMVDELMKLNAVNATTFAGRASQARRVGMPKTTAPPGPSIGDIAKPVGYGQKIPGATKVM